MRSSTTIVLPDPPVPRSPVRILALTARRTIRDRVRAAYPRPTGRVLVRLPADGLHDLLVECFDVVVVDGGDPSCRPGRVLAEVFGHKFLRAAPVVVVDGPETGSSVWSDLIRAGVRHVLPPGASVSALRTATDSAVRSGLPEVLGLRRELARTWRTVDLDPLTGLASRRVLERLLGTAPATGERRRPVRVGLLMIDIDNFKKVNDTHGHLAGDRVLIEVAARLSGLMRAGDVAVRWAGDELAALLPGADLTRAAGVAERLVRLVGQTPLSHENGVPLHGSVSVGVASGTAGEALVEQADRAMYAAKAAGRGRVRLDQPGPAPAVGRSPMVAAVVPRQGEAAVHSQLTANS